MHLYDFIDQQSYPKTMIRIVLTVIILIASTTAAFPEPAKPNTLVSRAIVFLNIRVQEIEACIQAKEVTGKTLPRCEELYKYESILINGSINGIYEIECFPSCIYPAEKLNEFNSASKQALEMLIKIENTFN